MTDNSRNNSDLVHSMKETQGDFIPNYDRSVLRTGSKTNQHYLSQKKRAQLQRQIKQMTDHCMKLIEKNSHHELGQYLQSQAGGSDDFAGDLDMSQGNIELPNRIRLNDLVDGEGFTLLHMAVFKNK